MTAIPFTRSSDPIAAPLRQAERLVADRRYGQALGQLGFVAVPVNPDPAYVARVLACEAAARDGLAAQRFLHAA